MKNPTRLSAALDLARTGDVDGALELLEEASEGPPDENVQGFLYMLLRARGRTEQAVVLATGCIETASEPLSRSTWHLRRGLLLLEAGRHTEAYSDLTDVLQLAASDAHTEQARRALARSMGDNSGQVH